MLKSKIITSDIFLMLWSIWYCWAGNTNDWCHDFIKTCSSEP